MPFKPAPSRDLVAGSGAAAPNNAQGRTGLGAMWDWATSLLGISGDPADARAALGLGSAATQNSSAFQAADPNTAKYDDAIANFTGSLRVNGVPVSVGVEVPRGFIDGLVMSTAGSSATVAVAPGQASNSTNAVLMSLASAMSKTTSAWAAGTGNGGLDTGTIANGTWYHFYLIRRPDTGAVDVIFSTSASAPTLPANYTQYRRIGSAATDGSAKWQRFFQEGDIFRWTSPAGDVSTTISTTPGNYGLSVPSGVKVRANLAVRASFSGGTDCGVWLYSPDIPDQAMTATLATVYSNSNGSSVGSITAQAQVLTNTASQVRGVANRAQSFGIVTFGWVDSRGKDQ